MREGEQEAFFDDLDDLDAVLLVAKAIAPELQGQSGWADVAARVLRGDTRSKLPEGLSGTELHRRQRGFVERGWVNTIVDAWRPHYEMDTPLALSVLQVAHRRGRLEQDFGHVFGSHRPTAVYGWDILRRARVLLVLGRIPEAMVSLSMPEFVSVSRGSKTWSLDLFGDNPPAAWLQAASDEVLRAYAKGIGDRCTDGLWAPPPPVLETVLEVLGARPLTPAKRYPMELLRAAMLALPAERSAGLTTLRGKALGGGLSVLHAFAQGELARCFVLGSSLLQSHPTQLRGLVALCMLLACVDAARRKEEGAWLRFDAVLQEARGRVVQHEYAMELLQVFREVELGVSTPQDLRRELDDCFSDRPHLPWTAALVGGLLTRWFPVGDPESLQLCVAAHARSAAGLGSALLPRTFEALADRSGAAHPEATLVHAYVSRAPWEHAVEQLEALADRLAPEGPTPLAPSIHWEVTREGEDTRLTPRLVRSTRSRQGRALSITDVLGSSLSIADGHDIAVAHAWLRHMEGCDGTRVPVPEADGTALVALVGHPRVRGPDGRRLSVVRGMPQVVVEGDGHGARIFVEPEALQIRRVTVAWDGPSKLVVYQVDESTRAVLEAMGGTPEGRVPLEALDRLLPVLPRLAGQMSLQARGSLDLGGEPVAPRTDLQVDLEWRSPMLRLVVGCWPLGRRGPRCTPGQGPPQVLGQAEHSLCSTTRDLDAELAALEALHACCPRLQTLDVAGDGAGLAYGFESACWVLGELTAAATGGAVTLAWPRGQPLRLSREYTVTDFNIAVRREEGHWLAIDAELHADEGEVLSWRLLGADALGTGRFVQLKDGQVLRLSASLRRKLDALDRLRVQRGAPADNDGLLVPEVVLPVLEGILGEDGGVSFSDELAPRRLEIETALSRKPRVPRSLRATLRDYQREGFAWMSRLADAGLGGVLADDMGLGKTVQTLALLLERKKRGPALVVCPTSVVANWCAEAQRFAPSLRVVDMSTLPRAQRAPTLTGLGRGTLAVMSYGLLSRFEGPLEVATVVFDEAHALKNASSARTHAAASILAEVRFGLTGTPIENHLGELWSVLHSCVPGLLGDEDVFRRTTAAAIQAGDAAAASHLRALIRPFLLRRTKDMVLTELPERTETLVMVEPGKRERAWYEAQRQLAHERLSASKGKEGKGRARIKILAEISRLRRAAVEPRLVDEAAPRGAKLDLVVERVQELVGAGHQVLVFTQFLGVLAMLGELLHKHGVRTLELQGSTSAAERARRIEAFQAGEADVFLMSLKAGGVGVNLTAADYVIHVDPWWNPAVEDQATGRAHRMGQTRPVTVYRYCTEHSIEPKILALHEDKRELAQDVLEGMSSGKTLDLDDLAALMR